MPIPERRHRTPSRRLLGAAASEMCSLFRSARIPSHASREHDAARRMMFAAREDDEPSARLRRRAGAACTTGQPFPSTPQGDRRVGGASQG